MRKRCAIMCLMLGTLTFYGQAFAHGTEEHGKTTPVDAQMKKLHAIMPMFSVASAKLKTALEKGDAATVEAEAGKILAAIPDLKKSRPHKNIKQRKNFAVLAADFDKRAAFKKVEEQCAACHAKFRE